jgi:GTP-binding protein Era
MSILEEFFSKEEIETLKFLRETIEEFNIVCTGLYNHGKSTLLNILIEDFELHTFKTSDARETIKNKKIKINDINYIDTPGLNAKQEDDKEVLKILESADILLLVHNINTGELNKKEIDFLKQIKNFYNKKNLRNKLIIVLSQIDKIDNIEDIEKTVIKINKQVKNILNDDIFIIPVSALDYKEGVANNEKELIKISNIPILKEKINFLLKTTKSNNKKEKKEFFYKKYKKFEKRLIRKRENNNKKIEKLKEKQKEKDQMLKEELIKIEKTLKEKYSKLI